MRYDPETGKLWREAGSSDGRGYIYVQFQKKHHLAHRVAWFLHYGSWPDGLIDHINGNKSDNRIKNLRLANFSENQLNRNRTSSNTSGHKGVSYHKHRKRWQALISVDGKNKFLGSFNTALEAADAYNEAALKYHGEFARTDL
jgi:hypothetical protein